MSLKSVLAGLWGVIAGAEPPNEHHDRAWEEFQKTWEMDVPPDPEVVFRAGYEAARKEVES